MKKILVMILAVCLLIPIAAADDGFDLSSLSFEQLLDLKQKVTAEIVSRPEWKAVTVPAGEWIIGVDIPAGYYSMSAEGLAITEAKPAGSEYFDFYHVLVAGETVGKVQFIEGSIFKTNAPVVLAPPAVLDF